MGTLKFCMNFRISLSISIRKSAEILMGIVLNLYINLGIYWHLNNASLPIHVHGMFFQLVRVSLISFINVLQLISHWGPHSFLLVLLEEMKDLPLAGCLLSLG